MVDCKWTSGGATAATREGGGRATGGAVVLQLVHIILACDCSHIAKGEGANVRLRMLSIRHIRWW